jgi:DNA-binding CsgD family transcriptional regulator
VALIDTKDEGMTEPVRRALDLVAIDVTAEIRVIRAALREVDVDPDALLAAEHTGALQFTEDRVGFVDPARRTSTVAALSPSERRLAHRALARAMVEPRHRAQRAEHLAAAVVGPDSDAAAALAELGREASERGEAAIAGELYMRSAGLSPDADDRALNLYHAADGYWNAGEYTAARAAFDAAYVGTSQPVLRADIAWQLGQLDMYQRGPLFARDLFVAAADTVEPHDIDRAARLLVHAASTVMLSSDVIGSLSLVRRAVTLAERGDGSSTMPAALMLAFLSLQHGDAAEFEELFPPLAALADELKGSDVAEIDLFLQLVGMVHVYTEQWDAGRVFLAAVAHRAGRRARFATAALASATLAELCWRSGRWDEAWALATGSLVTEVTLTGARLWLLAFTAHLDAGFGRADDCRSRARAAIVEGEAMGFGTTVIWGYHALGLLELGLGHPVASASHLDRVDAIVRAYEIVEPGGVWWQADHVEALVRSGRRHEAARALARFEYGAERSQRTWAWATIARCRALMAPTTGDAERFFAESLDHHDRLVAPFELARTLLCRAEQRIAARSDLDASGDLSEAIAIFDSLGAASWSAQGCALRDAVNDRAGNDRAGNDRAGNDRAGPTIEAVLSPAERRVAEAVAAGMSNREVAAKLYISGKTVEFHLHNVYTKLAIHSRSQLVRRFPQQ